MSADQEPGMVFDRGFQLFDGAHVGPLRTLMQGSPEFAKVGLRSSRVDLHAAVRKVAGEALEPQGRGAPAHEVTKPDALHASAYKPPPRLDLPGHEHEMESAKRARGKSPQKCSHECARPR